MTQRERDSLSYQAKRDRKFDNEYLDERFFDDEEKAEWFSENDDWLPGNPMDFGDHD
jgi:hypothetical protein